MRILFATVFLVTVVWLAGAEEPTKQLWPNLPEQIVEANDRTAAEAIERLLGNPYLQSVQALDEALPPKIASFEARYHCSVVVERRSLLSLLLSPRVAAHLAGSGQPYLLFFVSDDRLLFDGDPTDRRWLLETRNEDTGVWELSTVSSSETPQEWYASLMDEDGRDPHRSLRFAIVIDGQPLMLAPAQLRPLQERQVVVALDVRSLLEKRIAQTNFEGTSPGEAFQSICDLIDADLTSTLHIVYDKFIDLRVRDRSVAELLTLVLEPIGWTWRPEGWVYDGGGTLFEDEQNTPPAGWEPHPVAPVLLPLTMGALTPDQQRAMQTVALLSGAPIDPQNSAEEVTGAERLAVTMIDALAAQMQGSWRPLIVVEPKEGAAEFFAPTRTEQ